MVRQAAERVHGPGSQKWTFVRQISGREACKIVCPRNRHIEFVEHLQYRQNGLPVSELHYIFCDDRQNPPGGVFASTHGFQEQPATGALKKVVLFREKRGGRGYERIFFLEPGTRFGQQADL